MRPRPAPAGRGSSCGRGRRFAGGA